MYNDMLKKFLLDVNFDDAIILPEQIRYEVKDSFSTIQMYICDKKISFRVYGDAYVVAMTKWLQQKLKSKYDIKQITIQQLVDKFNLPDFKYRNASQLIELIEKINATII
ncbi:hypothetical protein [Francisella salimarina]|uniref:hypothetical protein n=1 Tax=Francisella salimarina TaxID=2599927 RepID=UPI0037512796